MKRGPAGEAGRARRMAAVVRLTKAGMRAPEVARELGMCTRTVGRYLRAARQAFEDGGE